MRKALVVGIDYYENCSQLYGCVTDAYDVKNALERNADGTLNFDVQTLLSTNDIEKVSKSLSSKSSKIPESKVMKIPDPKVKKLFIFTSFFLNILCPVAWTINFNYS